MTSPKSADSKVVIVEDNVEMAKLLKVWLETDYTVEVAHDCEGAFTLIDESVDVLLLDRQLPDGSGDEVLAHVREAGYDCRVAMVTAVDPGLDIIGMGFDDYLCKPMTSEELRGVVERLLAQSEYGKEVQRLYSLVSKKALLEASLPERKLQASTEYEELKEEISTLQADITKKSMSFSDAQFHAELNRL